MDLFLGTPSILMEPENERRAVGYGCAGNIRFQKWGQEYRVLSSYFASSEELIKWCFRNTQLAVDFVNEGKIERIINLGYDIMNCINTSDKAMAEQFVKEFEIPLL